MKRKHPDADCEHCPLFFDGKYVPTDGPKEAKIAIVGEAPGYYEAEAGKPFVGPSGRLLNQVLQHHNVDRSQVMVTNAVLCRPVDNETPPSQAIEACRPRLLGELQQRGVDKVLALGNSATESLLHKSGITKLRVGRGRVCKDNPNVEVIPSLHPAYVLRIPDNIVHLSADVGKLVSDALPWEEPEWDSVDDEESALAAIEQLKTLAPIKIACDIETHSEKDNDFGQPQQEGLLCIGIAYDHNRVMVFGEQSLNYKSVIIGLRDFINSVSNVVWHNGKSDLKGMYPVVQGTLKMTSDTLLMSYSLDEHSGIHKPHSLLTLSRELLGAPDWKSWLDPYEPRKWGYGVIPRPKLYKYNAVDCANTYNLETILRKRCVDSDVLMVHDFLVGVSKELIFLEMNGIGIDQDHLKILSDDYGQQLDELQEQLDSLLPALGEAKYDNAKKAKHLVNPNSPLQIKKVFVDFGVNTHTTDADMCKLLLERKGPDSPIGQFITKLLEYRGIAKQKGTYVDGIANRLYAGRVYTNFLLHGTTSGRLSSRNPNLQNVPRKPIIRKLYVPIKEENVFLQTDYSQAELRILCWLADDDYFTPIFNGTDRDVFDELSLDMFPQYPHPKTITEEQYWKLYPDPFPSERGSIDWKSHYKAEFKDMRAKKIKPFVYGVAYGRTEFGIAGDPDLNMTVMEAKQIMDKFLALIPKIVQWQKKIKKEVENGSDLVSPFGRRRRFPLITNDNHDDTMREALSFLPSSISSDLCLRAMCRVRQDTRGIAWVRNIVHDSILVECHKDRVEEVQNILERRMLESAYELVPDFVKFEVETNVGKSWGDV